MIKPLKKNILIEVMKIEQTAIMMLDEKEGLMEKAKVLTIGEEVENINVNDIIYFKNYETDEIVDGKDKYVLISEEAVRAIYEA